jgi:hypothetical protein
MGCVTFEDYGIVRDFRGLPCYFFDGVALSEASEQPLASHEQREHDAVHAEASGCEVQEGCKRLYGAANAATTFFEDTTTCESYHVATTE